MEEVKILLTKIKTVLAIQAAIGFLMSFWTIFQMAFDRSYEIWEFIGGLLLILFAWIIYQMINKAE